MEKEEEKDGSVGQPNAHHELEELNRDEGDEAEPADGVYPTLRSEDSGLGISASPSEQHLLPGMGAEGNGICKEGERVWRKGGSIDSMTQCLQDILASIATR